jgi:hypothetical protein
MEAWEQVVPANRTLFLGMRDERQRRREREQATLARLRETRIKPRGNGSGKEPISLFILGPSRSGKTATEQLTATLAGVKRGYENPIVDNAVRGTFQTAALLTNTFFEALPAQLDSQCRELYLEELARRAGSAKVFTNTHPVSVHDAARVTAAFPNVRFIFVKRNLEDVLRRIFLRKYSQGNAYAYDLRAARDSDHVLVMQHAGDVRKLFQEQIHHFVVPKNTHRAA